MNSKEILEQAMVLEPEERFMIVEGLLESLDGPDREMDKIWVEEAEKRLRAYRKGRLVGIPMEAMREKIGLLEDIQMAISQLNEGKGIDHQDAKNMVFARLDR